MHMAFPHCTARLTLCLKNGADLGSPVTSDRHFPISLMKTVASGPQGPRVSIATGVNLQLGVFVFLPQLGSFPRGSNS